MTSVRYEIDPDEAYDMANQDRLLRQDRGEFMEQLELDFDREFVQEYASERGLGGAE